MNWDFQRASCTFGYRLSRSEEQSRNGRLEFPACGIHCLVGNANLANRVVIPTLKRCGICRKLETDHDKADHPYKVDESLPKWHGWFALGRGVGTAVAYLSNSVAAKGLLRHSSVSTTERHYIKDVPESTLEAMKLLETLCNPSATEGTA